MSRFSRSRSTARSRFEPTRPRRGRAAALADVAETAKRADRLVPMKKALKQTAMLGEVSDVLRAEFGVYQPQG